MSEYEPKNLEDAGTTAKVPERPKLDDGVKEEPAHTEAAPLDPIAPEDATD